MEKRADTAGQTDAWHRRAEETLTARAKRDRDRARVDDGSRLGPETSLLAALNEVRKVAGTARFPLAVASAGTARDGAAALVTQLDDYMLPRVRRVDAPMLAVVGGSTGAGKSTLVNSLVRAPVSRAGALRPTTRAPLLVCHPADATWFGDRAVLPGLARASRPGVESLQVINAPLLVPGIALLDAPDIDSVVAANRTLAGELLAAGDLWLFVTTAARYADAVPWRVLREARERGTVVAIVLDRVPPEARDDISGHLARMLAAQGLDGAPLFTISESTLDAFGLLPEADVAPVKRWLDGVARSGAQRRHLTGRTLFGAVAAVGPRVDSLAAAAEDQVNAASLMAGTVRAAYAASMSNVEFSVRGGAVLRGEVLSRWHELLASGELRLALRATTGPRRTQVSAALAERPIPGRRFQTAIAAALAGMIVEADIAAALQCRQRWGSEPAGRALLAADPSIGQPSAPVAGGGQRGTVGDVAFNLVHDWQTWLRAAVDAETPRGRNRTRSYASASTALLATIAAVAPVEGDEAATGVGATMARSVMMRRVLTKPEVRALGERARAELLVRVGNLLEAEVDRRLAALADADVDVGLVERLRVAAGRVRAAQSGSGSRLGDAA